MKISKPFYLFAVVFVISPILISCAHTQAVATENEQVIVIPEYEIIPLPEYVEIALPPGLTNAQTKGASASTQLPTENIPAIAAAAPTGEVQPSIPAQQPAPLLAPAPAAETAAGQFTSEEMPSALPPVASVPPPVPLAPAAETTAGQFTSEEMPSALPPVVSAPPQQVLSPAPVYPSKTATAELQNIPAASQAAVIPGITQITKPPVIIPGEVLNGMPSYVNTQTTHIVKPGEGLYWIAAVYYGNARLWYKIYEANKAKIKDPNHLTVGIKLIIPPK